MPNPPEEQSVSLWELEIGLMEAAQRAQEGDETALAILGEYLEASADKRDRVALALRLFDRDIDFLKQEIEELEAQLARKQRAKEKLESRVIGCLQATGQTSIEGRTSKLSLRANPASVRIVDKDKIPPLYTVVKSEVVVDKKMLAAALKQGEVPGAELVTDKVHLDYGAHKRKKK